MSENHQKDQNMSARKLAAIMFTDRHSIFGWNYDIHPDGDKFVMVKGAEIDISRNQVNIIKNFDQELENKFATIR